MNNVTSFQQGDTVRLKGGSDEWKFVRYLPRDRDFETNQRSTIKLNEEVGTLDVMTETIELVRRRMNDKEKVAYVLNELELMFKPGGMAGCYDRLRLLRKLLLDQP